MHYHHFHFQKQVHLHTLREWNQGWHVITAMIIVFRCLDLFRQPTFSTFHERQLSACLFLLQTFQQLILSTFGKTTPGFLENHKFHGFIVSAMKPSCLVETWGNITWKVVATTICFRVLNWYESLRLLPSFHHLFSWDTSMSFTSCPIFINIFLILMCCT